jgi:2-oxoisovalerate dehydrogenase E1 component alpha subunit
MNCGPFGGGAITPGGMIVKTRVVAKASTGGNLMSSKIKHQQNKKPGKTAAPLDLPKQVALQILELMVKSRVLEERLIKIYKTGESYFWIGGPGEEAWGVPLGLLIDRGAGHKHDYLHFHYRCTPTLVAMGMPMIDAIRLMMTKATDPHTGGRNFSGHYCIPKWNVTPVSSPIEVQYGMAIGTAWAQRRENSKGITIVTGGDAGTAEGDFASCLVWASRKGSELPILITVQNNKWGISTSYDTQHGEMNIADRGKAFQMRTDVINGNDPVEVYKKLQEHMSYIRKTGKPVLVEALVSRLYGHSSATGANLIPEEDCLSRFTKRMVDAGFCKSADVDKMVQRYEDEGRAAQELVRTEPAPSASTIWDHTFANGENADWRKF